MVKSKKELSPLAQIIEKGAFLVDVRSPEEFASGTVEGAINVPLFSVPLRIDEFQGKDNIVVFCASGGRSYQAKLFLEESGIEGVTNGGGWYEVDLASKEVK